jgi:hypothetical protein
MKDETRYVIHTSTRDSSSQIASPSAGTLWLLICWNFVAIITIRMAQSHDQPVPNKPYPAYLLASFEPYPPCPDIEVFESRL